MTTYKTLDVKPSRRIRRVLRRRIIGDATLVAIIVDIELTAAGELEVWVSRAIIQVVDETLTTIARFKTQHLAELPDRQRHRMVRTLASTLLEEESDVRSEVLPRLRTFAG